MRREILIVGLTVLFLGTFFTIQVPYKVPYQVEEEVEYQVPYEASYQENETRQSELLNIYDFLRYDPFAYLSLPPTYYDEASVTMVERQNVSVSLSHAIEQSLPIDLYIFTEENFENWKKNSTDVDAVASWINWTDIEDSFIVPQNATYSVVIWNPFRTLFTTTVYIKSITLTATWEETVTKTEIEYTTEYKLENVTKYRTEWKTAYAYGGIIFSTVEGVIIIIGMVSKPKLVQKQSILADGKDEK